MCTSRHLLSLTARISLLAVLTVVCHSKQQHPTTNAHTYDETSTPLAVLDAYEARGVQTMGPIGLPPKIWI
jgi:hypothetical protein